MAYWEPLPELDEAPLVQPGSSFRDVTHDIARVTENKAPSVTCSGGASGFGAIPLRSTGLGTSRTSCGGSVSATRAR